MSLPLLKASLVTLVWSIVQGSEADAFQSASAYDRATVQIRLSVAGSFRLKSEPSTRFNLSAECVQSNLDPQNFDLAVVSGVGVPDVPEAMRPVLTATLPTCPGQVLYLPQQSAEGRGPVTVIVVPH